jgi:hypothetical protein
MRIQKKLNLDMKKGYALGWFDEIEKGISQITWGLRSLF